jgi:hypothetical protein
VFALIERRCAICHAPGGQSSDKPMTSYAEVHRLASTMLTQVYRCFMPPDGGMAMPLSSDERVEILTWLYCGAPNN